MYWYEYDILWINYGYCMIMTIIWTNFEHGYYMNMHDAYELMWTWMNIEYENGYEWHMPITNYWLIILNGMN